MSTTYAIASIETTPFQLGKIYRIRAESTTPGCSHWYQVWISKRGTPVVNVLDDSTGTHLRHNLDGEEITLAHDDPRLREIMNVIEEYKSQAEASTD